MNDGEDFESVIRAIEGDFAIAEAEKRGNFAVCIAHVAGVVMKSALDSGVPYELAQEMARDYWNSEMIPIEVLEAGNELPEEPTP
ncbi:hypothetical protein ACIQUL_36390 [Streptomyces sp. NPDC090303]|uniref:hypothetical protein n=1 Tax=Streptomyces sp. NPDC090303 TaxID=3365960 RepID=UPI0037F8B75E